MTIEVRQLDSEEWNEALARVPTKTAFHLAESLDVLAAHANARLHRLAGYKGEEVVGLFPIFSIDKGPVTAVFSPPPDLKIPYLGPVLADHSHMKRRLADRRHRRFVDGALDWVRDRYDPKFVNFRTTPGYEDARPLLWHDYEVTPRYTYVIDLDRPMEDVLASFNRNARRNITDDYDVDYEVSVGGPTAIERIVAQVAARHEEQGEPFPVSAEFVVDLYEALPDGVLRPYICEIDGEFAGGMVNVTYGETVVSWIGSARPDAAIPVNDIVEWRACTEAAERGVTRYDLSGANNLRLAKYKAKFTPELETFYRANTGDWGMNTALKLYNRLRR